MIRGPAVLNQWLGALMLLFALTVTTVHAAAPAPIVRSQITPEQARVGEVVNLELVILVPGWLTAPVDLPASLDILGVQARLDEGAALNVNENIGGIAYAGLRRRYHLVAQGAGRFVVPPVAFALAFADGTRRISSAVSSPPGAFEATLPKGLKGLGYMLVTPDFRLQQNFDRKLVRLHVGDALVRTLDQRAVGLGATQLPVLNFAETPGLATYPEAPKFNETAGERGAANVAAQTQRVTYVLERAGSYELPALELRWLDTRSGTMRTARAPSVQFEVQPAPAAAGTVEPVAASQTPSAPTQTPPVSLSPAARVRAFGIRFWPWLAGIAFLLLARRHQVARGLKSRNMDRSETIR